MSESFANQKIGETVDATAAMKASALAAMMADLGLNRREELSASHNKGKGSRVPAAVHNGGNHPMSHNERQAQQKTVRTQQETKKFVQAHGDKISGWNAKKFDDINTDDKGLLSIAGGDLHRRTDPAIFDVTPAPYPQGTGHQPAPRGGRGSTRGGLSSGPGRSATQAEDINSVVASRMGIAARGDSPSNLARGSTRGVGSGARGDSPSGIARGSSLGGIPPRGDSTLTARGNGDVLSAPSNGITSNRGTNSNRGNHAPSLRGNYTPSPNTLPVVKLADPAEFLACMPYLQVRKGLEASKCNPENATQQTAVDMSSQKENIAPQKLAEVRPVPEVEEMETDSPLHAFRAPRSTQEIILHNLSGNEAHDEQRADREARGRLQAQSMSETALIPAEVATDVVLETHLGPRSMLTATDFAEQSAKLSAEVSQQFELHKFRVRLGVAGQTNQLGTLKIGQDPESYRIFINIAFDHGVLLPISVTAIAHVSVSGSAVTLLSNNTPPQTWVLTTQVPYMAQNLFTMIKVALEQNAGDVAEDQETLLGQVSELSRNLAPPLQYLLLDFTDEELRGLSEGVKAEAMVDYAALLERNLKVGIESSVYAPGNQAASRGVQPKMDLNERNVAKYFNKTALIGLAPKQEQAEFVAGMTKLLINIDEKDRSAQGVGPAEPASSNESVYQATVDDMLNEVGPTDRLHAPVMEALRDSSKPTTDQGIVTPTFPVYERQELLDYRASALKISPGSLPLTSKDGLMKRPSETTTLGSSQPEAQMASQKSATWGDSELVVRGHAVPKSAPDHFAKAVKSSQSEEFNPPKEVVAKSLPLLAASAVANNSDISTASKEAFSWQSAVVETPLVNLGPETLPTAVIGNDALPATMNEKPAEAVKQSALTKESLAMPLPLALQNGKRPANVAQKSSPISTPVGPIYYQSTGAATSAAVSKQRKSGLETSAYANVEDDAVSNYAPPQLQKRKCNFDIQCNNQDCHFAHPETAQICPYLPKCAKNICPFVHPVCKFGSGCANPVCRYSHVGPDGLAIVREVQESGFQARGPQTRGTEAPAIRSPGLQGPAHSNGILCRHAEFCTKPACPFEHTEPNIMCKWDGKCMKPTCKFKHTE